MNVIIKIIAAILIIVILGRGILFYIGLESMTDPYSDFELKLNGKSRFDFEFKMQISNVDKSYPEVYNSISGDFSTSFTSINGSMYLIGNGVGRSEYVISGSNDEYFDERRVNKLGSGLMIYFKSQLENITLDFFVGGTISGFEAYELYFDSIFLVNDWASYDPHVSGWEA